MSDKKAKALELADANSDLIQRLRRTPMRLADLIPHIQSMGDELRRLHAEAEEFNHLLSVEHMARETLDACAKEAQEMAIELSWGNQKLIAEIERLNKVIQFEQHRAERIGTHGPGCETWGPQHYECAIRKLKEQQDSMERVLKARDRYGWSVEADVEIEAMRDLLIGK